MKNKIFICILVFLFSLAVRLIFISFSLYPYEALKFYDAPSWDGIAKNLISKKSFLEPTGEPTSIRPPIYPIFLAFIYLIFGFNYKAVFIVQSVISSLTNVILFLLCSNFISLKVGMISSFVSVIWPPFVVYSGIICSETLYIFLLLTFLFFFLKENKKTWQNLALGILLGVINLTRSTIVFYTIFLIFYNLFFGISTRKVKEIIIITVVSFVVLLPWTIRNYLVFGRFLLINTAAGELFWSGTYLKWDGVCKHDRDEDFFKKFGSIENPIDRDKEMFKEGIKNIINNPKGFIKLSVKKFFRFWFKPAGYEILKGKYILFARIYFFVYIFLVLLCWGYLIKITKDKILHPLFVLILYFTIMHNLLAPIPRYRLPIEHLILSFAFVKLFNVLHIDKSL